MNDKYILDENNQPVRATLMEWAQWFEHNDAKRRVGYTDISADVNVSTVFLGLDHRFGLSGTPLLWETMIFGGEHDGYQERFTSHDDAVKGHELACQIARGAVGL